MKIFIQFAFFSALCFVFSCNEEVEKLDDDFKAAYYLPLELGKFIDYRIDSVQYDPIAECAFKLDTVSYLIREEVYDVVEDLAGDSVFRVKIYRKDSLAGDWEFQKLISVKKSPSEVILTEDNIPLLKLVFPLSINRRWATSAYADPSQIVLVKGESLKLFVGWSRAEVDQIGQPYSIGSVNFNDCLHVTQTFFDDQIDYRYYSEVYAKDIGLIEKELYVLFTTCCEDPGASLAACRDIAWEEKAEKGFYIKQSIIDHN